jgi:single stranded DNA-binding protein
MSFQTRCTKNLVIVSGWVGDTPEVIPTKFGQITKVRVATSEAYNIKSSGEQVETDTWHDIAFFGNKAEYAANNIKKGMLIDVEGKLSQNKWTDQYEQARVSVAIKVDERGEVRILREAKSLAVDKQATQKNTSSAVSSVVVGESIPM